MILRGRGAKLRPGLTKERGFLEVVRGSGTRIRVGPAPLPP